MLVSPYLTARNTIPLVLNSVSGIQLALLFSRSYIQKYHKRIEAVLEFIMFLCRFAALHNKMITNVEKPWSVYP